VHAALGAANPRWAELLYFHHDSRRPPCEARPSERVCVFGAAEQNEHHGHTGGVRRHARELSDARTVVREQILEARQNTEASREAERDHRDEQAHTEDADRMTTWNVVSALKNAAARREGGGGSDSGDHRFRPKVFRTDGGRGMENRAAGPGQGSLRLDGVNPNRAPIDQVSAKNGPFCARSKKSEKRFDRT